VEVGQELSFGAAKRDQVPRQTRNPRAEFRVADVRFEGSPGFTRNELLDHLSQRPGTTFDFVRWQEDRDRLERVYRDRGFLEARIGARRAEAPQGPMPAVVLEYQVERGPRTTLLISGATLHRAVYRDLEDLWAGAVFDELLADDLASRVRRHLAETGHLQPSVAAHLELDPARATKTVRIQIDPGTRSEIREVHFEGAAAISPDRLQAFLQQQGLERTIWVDRERVERELEAFYRRAGYLGAEVAIPPPTREGRIARLEARIAEGSPFTIGTVKLTGVERRDSSFVQRELTLEPGTLFRPDLIDEGVRRLEQGYRDNGYREVQIQATTVVDRPAAAVDVTVGVREGPQHLIQDVAITGVEAADQQTIDRALQLSSGQPVNAAALSEARRRLYRLGRFERVDIQGAPVGEPKDGVQPVRAAVTLQEAPRYVVRYALQGTSAFDAEAEGRDVTASALAELRRRNLFGRGASAGGVLLYRPNRRIARASLTVPALLAEGMESSAYLSRSQERFGSGFLGRFVANRTELTLEQLYRSRARGALVVNYRYERNHTFAEADPEFFDLTVSVARLSGSFVLDRRDDPLNTRRGLLHSSTLEYASPAFGSDLHFAKWLMQQFLYRPAGPVVFASAARVGAGYPLGGDLTLIPSERFLTGGSTSVRGYVTDSLGPQSGLGDPTGGQGFLLVNQEARFPVYGWLAGVGFIDAGNVFERAQDISFRGLKVGVGVGLRINTPVALLRFDVARPWSPRSGEPGYRWHFSIGQLF
jgi:outer membrane protein insertion porin family